jgi:hypothetical protein
MIISIDAEKASDKLKHSFMINALETRIIPQHNEGYI